MNICVYGASSTTIEQFYIDAGEKLGEEMAKRSIELNGLEEKITVINKNLKDLKEEFESGTIDAITVNPPYKAKGSGIINEENESVSDVSIHSQGKIIYIRATFTNVTADRAKEIASSTLEVISDKYLNNYDIHYTLISNATESATGFIVMGAKNIGEAQKQIIWGSVTTKEIQSKEE